jgi:ribosomal protein S19E (S16A)
MSMAYGDYAQGELNALQRVNAGSDVDPHMWAELAKKELVERRLGKRVLTAKGRLALGII